MSNPEFADEWQAPPIQMRLTPEWARILPEATAEGYSTFGASLRWGILGVEATLPVFMVETDPDAVGEWGGGVYGEAAWWSALGLQFVPISEGGPVLRLFWLPSTFFEHPCVTIRDWHVDELGRLLGDFEEVLMGHMGSTPGQACWEGIVTLLSDAFDCRAVTDPASQIPNYQPEHAARLYRT